jgi:hypothetical protein
MLAGGVLVVLVAGGVALADGAPERADEPGTESHEATTQPGTAGGGAAGRAATNSAQRGEAASREFAPVMYVPPARGRAQYTAAGATRGIPGLKPLDVAVLAPEDHVALTTRAQPTLYWFVSEDTDARIDLTLVDEASIDPLLEWTVPSPVTRGIHALDLAEHGVRLEAGKVYRWHVAVVRDARRRANDIFDQGLIERTEAPAGLERSLADAEDAFAPYARSGIWYDAMAELQSALREDPQNPKLRAQEAAFLEAIKLTPGAR